MGGQKVTASHTIARRVFALRISTLLHFRRKPPACLPVTVYKPGSTAPSAHHARALPHRLLPALCCKSVSRPCRPRSSHRLARISKQPRRRSAMERRYPMRMWWPTSQIFASRAAAHSSRACRCTHGIRATARHCCRPRELLAQMIGEPPPARAPAQGRTHPGKPDPAPIPCVHLPILLANEMCEDHPAFRMVRSGARRQRPA